jgi:glycosyltransferase involved in cell wall biosynthesis
MRILYTHRTQGVGAEGAHILGMYEAFAELGHEVEMHCLPGCNPALTANDTSPRAARPAATPLAKLYRFVGERCPQLVFEIFELLYNLPLFVQLALRYRRFRPDLVYERYALNTFAPSLLCRLTGCRHVLELNDSVTIERSRPLVLARIAAFWERFCLRSAGLSITITDRFRTLLAERFGIEETRILVLPNAVSRARFDRSFDRAALRQRLALGSRTVLGASGQFLPWHGLEQLVGQLADVAAERDLHFLFIGDGPARGAVLARARAAGIADRVTFTGMVSIGQVPGYLAALDMAVIPSAAPHASPMKLIEYMAAGLPVVAPDLPAVRAVAREGLAEVFPPGDFGRMRLAVLRILENREDASAMGRGAREHALSNLTWTGHAEAILRHVGCWSGAVKQARTDSASG